MRRRRGARPSPEFEEAREFLARLPQPQVVVPGNHDVPLYRAWERLLNPLGNYRRHIAADREPAFADGEIAVVGVNTARSLTFKNGRINGEQIGSIRRRVALLDPAVPKAVVTHHPFDLPGGTGDADPVGRARPAMAAFARCGVDLLLAGQFHASAAGATSQRHEVAGDAALLVQAGTATSTRNRGEGNSFNVLHAPARRSPSIGWCGTPALAPSCRNAAIASFAWIEC